MRNLDSLEEHKAQWKHKDCLLYTSIGSFFFGWFGEETADLREFAVFLHIIVVGFLKVQLHGVVVFQDGTGLVRISIGGNFLQQIFFGINFSLSLIHI